MPSKENSSIHAAGNTNPYIYMISSLYDTYPASASGNSLWI